MINLKETANDLVVKLASNFDNSELAYTLIDEKRFEYGDDESFVELCERYLEDIDSLKESLSDLIDENENLV